MPETENNFIRTWIYSYLKYGGVATQEQKNRSKKRFLEYLDATREDRHAVRKLEKELQKKE